MGGSISWFCDNDGGIGWGRGGGCGGKYRLLCIACGSIPPHGNEELLISEERLTNMLTRS